jgi:ATP-dependent exoDNAse (exonuclease V) beta subunit
MERDAVLDLLQRYRAATSRDDTPTPVLAWLDTAIDAGEPNRAAFDRFLGVFNPLRRDTVEQPADAMIERIIESTGVAHAELLARSDRDARIASLVALLRFARERLKRLTEPRDLAAFFEYYNDLDDRDKELRIDAPDPEGIESFQGDDGTGVRLMTGHAAKGLEAETVFVTRVDSQHGFPSRKNRNDESLPACLTPPDEGVAPRTAQQAIDDEERRLFYVASTRARSRLVILGTPPKNKGPNTVNYFCEIRDTPDLAILRTQADILEGSAADELSGMTATLRAGDAYRTRLAHAQRDARDKAARALDNAATPDVTAESLDTIARTLRSYAEHLGVIAAARAGEALPPWAVTTELRSLHSTLQPAEADAEDGDNLAHGLRALAAPLHLSYSMLNAYKRCGRCFYLSHVHRLAESTTSSLLVGAAAHTALEKFAHLWQHAEADGLPTPGVETLAKLADDALLALVPTTEAVDPLQREQLRAQMHHAIEDFAGPTTEIRDTELDIKTNYHCDGVDHRLTAKIDRYDQIGNAYRIIDYKTGKPSESKLMPKADDLQFALYTIALADHLNMPSPDDLIGTAEYWVLSTGERGRVKLEDIAARLPRTRKAIDTLIAGILAGAYKQGTPGYGCSGACNAFFGE